MYKYIKYIVDQERYGRAREDLRVHPKSILRHGPPDASRLRGALEAPCGPDHPGWADDRVGSSPDPVGAGAGEGTGEEIKSLSEQIQASVVEKFGIQLQAEVNFI